MSAAQQSKSTIRYTAWKEAIFGEALRLFREGCDTLEIARILNISEAEAHKRVSTAISHSNRRKAVFVPHGEHA